MSEKLTERTPLHQKGCKITLGARSGLAAPPLQLALRLVLERRASSRILLPIAAEKIQRTWKAHRAANAARADKEARQAAAATALQGAWRRVAAQSHLMVQRGAQQRLAAAARGTAQRRIYRRQLQAIVAPLALIQAAVRGWAVRRQLRDGRAAARKLQATWRRVRCVVLRRRLARAANALREGGTLEKYRQRKGGKHERHERFAWVSDDLQAFMWAPVADRQGDTALKLRSIPMASITAVTEGVKTPLLKKMGKRADEPQRMLSFARRPLAVDESCAFSIICRERVIDFYAADLKSRDAWLANLKTALTYGHTYDNKAAMAAVERLAAEPSATALDSDHDEA